MAEKIGIYVCHCGSNIAGTVDVEEVARWAGKNIKDVVVSRDYKFMCSSLGQQMIEDDIKKEGLTRRGRGRLLAAPAREDLPPGLQERRLESVPAADDQRPRARAPGSTPTRQAATEKTKALVSAAAERVKHQQPLEPMYVKVNPATLVVGGGIAGLQATLELADAGYHGLPGRARTVDRRPHGPVRQDLPHAGLLGLHPHAQDVRGRPARERHHATPTPNWRK